MALWPDLCNSGRRWWITGSYFLICDLSGAVLGLENCSLLAVVDTSVWVWIRSSCVHRSSYPLCVFFTSRRTCGTNLSCIKLDVFASFLGRNVFFYSLTASTQASSCYKVAFKKFCNFPQMSVRSKSKLTGSVKQLNAPYRTIDGFLCILIFYDDKS